MQLKINGNMGAVVFSTDKIEQKDPYEISTEN